MLYWAVCGGLFSVSQRARTGGGARVPGALPLPRCAGARLGETEAGVNLLSSEELYRVERQQMVQEIQRLYQATGLGRGAEMAATVLEAMREAPRHLFVPQRLLAMSYQDRALPIGCGQTISQPFIVALMTQLTLAGTGRLGAVLEVGAGSGYQAAVLAGLADRVYTIEIVEELGRTARGRLVELGYENVQVRVSDGYRGWPEHAPFDAVIVSAAPIQVPSPLLEQLKPGGRLVLPVGRQGGRQSLQVVRRAMDGSYPVEDILPVAFVPLTGEGVESLES